MAEADDVLQAGPDAGPVVGLGGRELERAGALPHGDDRDGRAAQVVEQPRLVLHVAEEDDRVGVAGLEDRRQGDALVEPALGVAEDDVVAVAHRLDRERLDGAGEERVAEVADDRADEHRRRAAQAAGERDWAGSRAPPRPARTRARVSAAIGTLVAASLRTRETVLCETPATRAMSRIVVTIARSLPPRDAVIRLQSGRTTTFRPSRAAWTANASGRVGEVERRGVTRPSSEMPPGSRPARRQREGPTPASAG